ncbi:MAG: helix-turn-helix domain-containing protein [Caldilinea sp.]|nr:helix-turn-helix domain-containing protein [Caldilinea sp.]MDW8439852.1 helix-turn-helix domain-containing protein [Caldilineaceae bacterium]
MTAFESFGELLKHLRRRARLTQRDLGLAVGYSEAQINRLEKGLRKPDPAVVRALFIEALGLEREPETAALLLRLATKAAASSPRQAPPPASRNGEAARRTNLPAALNPFINRVRERAELQRLLCAETPRLVTVTGPGGIGKTRLAQVAAGDALSRFSGGVWWVELATCMEGEQVIHAVRHALCVETRSEGIEAIVAFLQPAPALLVLDNCEQVASSCARLVESLLGACPLLKVLATSREPLGAEGEHLWPTPLLEAAAAAELFALRARAVRPNFTPTPSQTATIAMLCAQLDHLPLAIELAAAQCHTLSPAQIAERLATRFRFVMSGRATLPRHRSLQASLDWSHEMLTPTEKRLFARLSVVHGGWNLDAAEAVVADDLLDRAEVALALIGLARKSLIIVREDEEAMRYAMLETVRAYAQEQCTTLGESETLAARHAAYYLAWSEEQKEAMIGPKADKALHSVMLEIDNLRAALSWFWFHNALEAVAQLCWNLKYFWTTRGLASEGMMWIERLLSRRQELSPRALAVVLAGGAALAYRLNRLELVRRLAEEGIPLQRMLGHLRAAVLSLQCLGFAEMDVGEDFAAAEHLQQALDLIAEHLPNAANAWANISGPLAELLCRTGRYAEGMALFAEVLARSRKESSAEGIAVALLNRAWIALQRGDDRYISDLTEALTLLVNLHHAVGVATSVLVIACAATRQGSFEDAALLFGAGEALLKAINADLSPFDRAALQRFQSECLNAIGDERYAVHYNKGGALSATAASEFGLTVLTRRSASSPDKISERR